MSVTKEEYEGVQPGEFQDVLCFGSVPVGTTVEKCVEIFNMSMVCGERDCFLGEVGMLACFPGLCGLEYLP